MKREVLIAGLGKMGSALALSLDKAGYNIRGFDIEPDKGSIKSETSLENLLTHDSPIIVAVKPDKVEAVLQKIPDSRLIISIAAGVSLVQLQSMRKIKGPVIRSMPNIAVTVNKGMTCFVASKDCSGEHIEFAQNLFQTCGEVIKIEDDEKMHLVTALSGSGPAYIFEFLQAFEDAGVFYGLSRTQSRKLALQTLLGAGELALISDRSPQDLIHDVTSPGGTTIAGLRGLSAMGFREAVFEAVSRAYDRSFELMNKSDGSSDIGFK